MKRDYAKRYYVHKTKSNKPKFGFVLLVLFLVLGAGMGAYLKFHPEIFLENPTVITFFDHVKKVFIKQKPTATDIEKQKSDEKVSVHFSFYNALPAMRVEVVAKTQPGLSSAAAASEPMPTPVQIGYILQFGVFKEYAQASALRLSLLLGGIETEIDKIDKDQKVDYRIQQGPFSTLAQAKLFQKKWQKKGMETVVKKI